MGYLKEKHGMQLLGITPPGTCTMCAVAHRPEEPHNKQSLAYQYKFYDENGRWASWADAMEHCPEEIKKAWKEALQSKGIDINEYDRTEVKENEQRNDTTRR